MLETTYGALKHNILNVKMYGNEVVFLVTASLEVRIRTNALAIKLGSSDPNRLSCHFCNFFLFPLII